MTIIGLQVVPRVGSAGGEFEAGDRGLSLLVAEAVAEGLLRATFFSVVMSLSGLGDDVASNTIRRHLKVVWPARAGRLRPLSGNYRLRTPKRLCRPQRSESTSAPS